MRARTFRMRVSTCTCSVVVGELVIDFVCFKLLSRNRFTRASRGGFQSLPWHCLFWHVAEKSHPNTHAHTPHTHTNEMSYMRCFKDIATAGTGLVDADAVQPDFTHFAQQEFIGAKSGFDLHGVLANVC